MVLAHEAFTTVLMVVDQNNNPATGKSISYRIFDETLTLKESGTMTEIGSYGIYYKTWTPDADGYWVFEAYYSGADFKFYDIKMYQVGKGVEDQIYDRIGAPQVGATIALDIANLITRSKGLDEIHDDLALHDTTIQGLIGLPATTLAGDILVHDGDIKALIGSPVTDLATDIADLITRSKGLDEIHDDLATHDADIKADLGDFSGQSNLTSLLAALGIPDVIGKPLYTCLITDRLDNATYGLAALDIDLGTIITRIGDPSGDTLITLTAKFGDLNESLTTIFETFVASESGGFGDRMAFIQQHIAKGTGTVLPANKSLYDVIALDRLDHATYGLSALDTEIDALENKLKASPSVDSILFKSGGAVCPAGKSIWDALGDGTVDLNDLKSVVDDIISDTNELQTDWEDGGRLDLILDGIENKLKASPSVDSILFKSGGAVCPANKSIWDALGDGTIDLNALDTSISNLNADLGDYSAQSNLTSLLQALGIPDVAGKSLYTCLVTDRLDNATYGLSALETLIDDLENMLKASPSTDSILFKSGGSVCPANKSIWDALGDGTVDLNDIYDLVDAILDVTRSGGTLTADGNEQNVYINDAPTKNIVPRDVKIDLTDMQAGDTTVIKVYYRVKNGGGYILCDLETYNGAQSVPLVNIGLLSTRYGIKVTLQQSAGVNRDYDWEAFYGG